MNKILCKKWRINYFSKFYALTMEKMTELKISMSNEVKQTNIENEATTIQEGKAKISFSSSLDVFYNPVQEFNRDISIAAIRLFASDYAKLNEHKLSVDNLTKRKDGTVKISLKYEDFSFVQSNIELLPSGIKYDNGIKILEALSASGLRSIRYAQDIGGVKEIIANDYSESAVSCMENNIKINKVEELVSPSRNDANIVMYGHRDVGKRFHVVDIDPYGSPHVFLEAALQCVEDGGILLVTATDMAVLCGKSPETSYAKYGAISQSIPACHEMALRILLQSIEHHANKYGRYIHPLLSLSVDFYCRVIVRVFTSKKKVKESFTKIGMVHRCVGCETIDLQPLGKIYIDESSVRYMPSTLTTNKMCEHCGHRKKTGGPVWLEALHDKEFVKRLNNSLVEEDFNTYKRMKGMLTMAQEELDVPFYLVLDNMYKLCKIEAHKMKTIMSPILNAGYNVSLTHAKSNSIKTDAPMTFMWDVLRALSSGNLKNSKWPDDHPARKLLHKNATSNVDFALHPHAEFIMQPRGFIKFQNNPEKYWGPKCKATTNILKDEMQNKRIRMQGKRKQKIINVSTDSKKAKL